MKTSDEPPSRACSLVIVGLNSRGGWVAQEQNGLFGGLFVNRMQAVKFALFENGHHPEAIVLTNKVVELDTHRRPVSEPQAAAEHPREFDRNSGATAKVA